MIDYDAHDWRGHLLDIRGSMVREIVGRVTSCGLWATAVTVAQWELKQLGWSLAIPETGHALIGVALGMLLVFRTNASYDRFWEGRKQWGTIVNETRNLARSASVCLADDPATVRRVIRWTAVFPWATMHRLRGVRQLGRATESLPETEIREVLDATHLPLAVACRITGTLDAARRRGALSDYLFASIDQNVQILIDSLGACERIHNTPLPFAYVVHLRRAIIIYCTTLPFAMLDRFGWLTIPTVFIITYTLFGVEEIGVEIEDPFGDDDNDLPLESICARIEQDITSLIPPETAPLPVPPETAPLPVPPETAPLPAPRESGPVAIEPRIA